ncbi:MAG: hypothetical protein IJ956_02205, partial [Akkermansia sp.]|nr:hypothetical protein [Akkermansia sp.]
LIAVAFLGMASVWADALYTDLRVKFCDEKKGIIYNGAGEFSVQSPAARSFRPISTTRKPSS